MHFAGRMDDERAGNDGNDLFRCAHRAAAFEAEVDLGGVRMTMIRADLARLPACDRHIAGFDLAEYFLDVFLRVEFGLVDHAENMHRSPPRALMFVINTDVKIGRA